MQSPASSVRSPSRFGPIWVIFPSVIATSAADAGRAAAVDDGATADDQVSRHWRSPPRDSGRLSFTIFPITPAGGPATVPPSTGIVTPVTWADRSLAKYSAVCATSSAEPRRCSGWVNSITGPMS